MKIFNPFSSLDQDKKRKMRIGFSSSMFIVLTIGVAFAFAAPTNSNKLINASDASVSGNATKSNSGIKFDTTTTPTTIHDMSNMTTIPGTTVPPTSTNYQQNLAMLKASPYRNTNEDNSIYKNVASAALPLDKLYGPRSEYPGDLGGGNGEGRFREGCSFSHFSYDDPIVYPNQPGVAHLHMNFGNTDTNAFSNYDTIINSGGGTCNGKELNRTAYWAPAIIDGQGNARIPYRILIYYKSFGSAIGQVQPYPENQQVVADSTINAAQFNKDIFSFKCVNQYNGVDSKYNQSLTLPNCSGDKGEYLQDLEMNVKFPRCYNPGPNTPADYKNTLKRPIGDWYFGQCPADAPVRLPNLEYRILYRIPRGEDTSTWFLSSDVNKSTGEVSPTRGASVHADWFGGWNKTVNKLWVDGCNNTNASDCNEGYLGGSTRNDSRPALKFRTEYNGPLKIKLTDLFPTICKSGKTITKPADAAYCK